MPIDDWLPSYDFVERHRTLVRAPRPVVYQTLRSSDLGSHPIVRVLMGIRSLPARWLGSPEAGPSRLDLDALLERGFVLLEERAPAELVLGLTGRFWSLAGGTVRTDPARFREPPPPGTARVATNFALSQAEDGRTLLSTETRILCADAAARRAFGRYWLLIRPGSGLIRRAILSRVRKEAERRAV